MDKLLANKKILFIGIDFYDYELAIIEELKDRGAVVDYFKIGLSNVRIKITKFVPFLRECAVKKLNRNILKKVRSRQYDCVFVIKGDFCRPFLFEELKKNLDAIFIMYQWDSIARVKNFEINKKYFDFIYSFDRVDANKIEDLIFRPLFYITEFANRGFVADFITYDIYSISVYYEYRYIFLKKISEQLTQKKVFLKLRISIPSYVKNVIFKHEKLDKQLVIFSNISTKENIELMRKSKIILDVSNPIQNGLTMRTIEAVGMGKKLITTNRDIINYDFYSKENICIIDYDEIFIDDEFFDNPYKPLSKEIHNNYTISKWVNDIFSML